MVFWGVVSEVGERPDDDTGEFNKLRGTFRQDFHLPPLFKETRSKYIFSEGPRILNQFSI